MRPPSHAASASCRADVARVDRSRDEAGSVAVELTLVTPLLIVLLLFVVAAGRITSARLTVQDAAQAAARAATLSPVPGSVSGTGGTGDDRATSAALDATQKLPCRHLTVTVTDPRSTDTSPSGTAPSTRPRVVTAHVTCTVDLSGLTGLGLPGQTDVSATATSPLDRYRSTP